MPNIGPYVPPHSQDRKLPEDQNAWIFKNRVVPDLFGEGEKIIEPATGTSTLFVVGGPPGSRKTEIVELIKEKLRHQGSQAVEVSMDVARKHHPRFEEWMQTRTVDASYYTNHDAGIWAESALALAIERGCHVIFEGVMRSPEHFEHVTEPFCEARYLICAEISSLDAFRSKQGVIMRYWDLVAKRPDHGGGQMVPWSAFETAFEGLPKTVKHIEEKDRAHAVTVYGHLNNEVHPIQSRINRTGINSPALQTLLTERARDWTERERVEFVDSYNRIIEMLKHPALNATPSEIQEIENALAAAQSKIQPIKSKRHV
jgi:Zeta toxin